MRVFSMSGALSIHSCVEPVLLAWIEDFDADEVMAVSTRATSIFDQMNGEGQRRTSCPTIWDVSRRSLRMPP